MRIQFHRCIALLLLLFVFPAFAQDDANTQKLLQFAANNESFDKRIQAQAKTVFLRQFPGCPSVNQVVRQLPQAYSSLQFPSVAEERFPAPTDGIWVEHVKVRACDKIRQINLLAAGQADGTVTLLSLLPGDTRTDAAIQMKAERVGALSITQADATCSDTPAATNTRVLGFKQADGSLGKQDASQGWFEEWDYRFCQKDVAVQMAFLPNAEGAYDVKARPVGVNTPQVPAAKPAGPAEPTSVKTSQ